MPAPCLNTLMFNNALLWPRRACLCSVLILFTRAILSTPFFVLRLTHPCFALSFARGELASRHRTWGVPSALRSVRCSVRSRVTFETCAVGSLLRYCLSCSIQAHTVSYRRRCKTEDKNRLQLVYTACNWSRSNAF